MFRNSDVTVKHLVTHSGEWTQALMCHTWIISNVIHCLQMALYI